MPYSLDSGLQRPLAVDCRVARDNPKPLTQPLHPDPPPEILNTWTVEEVLSRSLGQLWASTSELALEPCPINSECFNSLQWNDAPRRG